MADTATANATASMPPPPPSRVAGRVPSALQAVFLASCRGVDVLKPPAEASRTFRGRFFFQRKATKASSNTGPVPAHPKSKTTALLLRPGLFFRRKTRRGTRQQPDSVLVTEASHQGDTNSVVSESIPSAVKVPTETVPVEVVEVDVPESPQDFLDALLKSRGYLSQRYNSAETAYKNDPTPLQLASYDVHLIKLVRQGDTEQFRAIFTTGISPNPCNAQGESLLHTVCRRDSVEFLRIMLEEAKSSVQQADDYGRNPLHDACWSATPDFEKIQMLLERDVHLIQLLDARGATPLMYTRKEDWPMWIKFLEDNKDRFWPEDKSDEEKQAQPPLALLKSNSQPVPDPQNALSIVMAAMVAGKRLSPEEAIYLREDSDDEGDDEDSESGSDEDSDDYDSEDDSEDDSDFDSDDDSCNYEDEEESSSCALNDDEMANILQTVGLPNNMPPPDVAWSSPRPYDAKQASDEE